MARKLLPNIKPPLGSKHTISMFCYYKLLQFPKISIILMEKPERFSKLFSYLPETANLISLWSSSATVISPPVWHSREPFSLQIETVEAINFSRCWKRSWLSFSLFTIGVERGDRHRSDFPLSLTAMLQYE